MLELLGLPDGDAPVLGEYAPSAQVHPASITFPGTQVQISQGEFA